MSKPPVPTEDQEQAALFQWAAACNRNDLDLMYAIPNGGVRNKVTAVRLKATGVKAGVPDICLPVARSGYFGMYIEIKRTKGSKLSECQSKWRDELNYQGYLAIVCYGWEEARGMIVQYLSGPWTPKTEG